MNSKIQVNLLWLSCWLKNIRNYKIRKELLINQCESSLEKSFVEATINGELSLKFEGIEEDRLDDGSRGETFDEEVKFENKSLKDAGGSVELDDDIENEYLPQNLITVNIY